MKILTRYILREFLVPLAYCLAGFVSIYVLFELFGSFSRIMDAKLPLKEVVMYFAAYLSPFFHYLAPAALMLATLYTMWNFCRHSEITALRASGISLGTIVAPLLCVAAAMAVFVAWVNESFMPAHANWARQMKTEHFSRERIANSEKIGYCNSKDDRVWLVKGTHDAACSKLTDVQVSVNREDGRRLKTVSAKTAEYLDGEWWFDGVKTQYYGETGRPVASPVPELDRVSFRSFPEFTERPGDFVMQNSNAQFCSVPDKLKYIEMNSDLNEESRASLKYEAWGQAVSPLACLVITLLAVPGGMTTGRQSVLKSVVGSLSMLFSYNAFVIACMVLAKTGLMPPIPAAIVPVVLFTALGAVFCYRPVSRVVALMFAYFVLFAAYVALARVLAHRLSVDAVMAHSLAATIPAMAAFVLTCPGIFVPLRRNTGE